LSNCKFYSIFRGIGVGATDSAGANVRANSIASAVAASGPTDGATRSTGAVGPFRTRFPLRELDAAAKPQFPTPQLRCGYRCTGPDDHSAQLPWRRGVARHTSGGLGGCRRTPAWLRVGRNDAQSLCRASRPTLTT